MKKSIIGMLICMLCSAAIFAAPESYVIKSVTGKVQYEAAPGNWKDVSVGQKLSASTVVNTSLNSTLVVSGGTDNVTIKAMQKGTVSSLASATGTSNGIKKGATISKSGITADSSKKSISVATASSRASEAKEDVSWDE